MIRNLIKAMWRAISKNKLTLFINTIGLATGMAAFLLLMIFVNYETGYDKQHERYDRIFRLRQAYLIEDVLTEIAFSPASYGPALVDMFPEIRNFTRLTFFPTTVHNESRNVLFNESKFALADSTFFEIFNFPLRQGNRADVLDRPFTLVLTPSAATKYFGADDPIGKTLRVAGNFDFVVTGVLESEPEQSHIDFDVIASFSTLYSIPPDVAEKLAIGLALRVESKTFSAYYTYVVLQDGVDFSSVNRKIPSFIEKFVGDGRSKTFKPLLQPMQSIHLESAYRFEIEPNSSYTIIYTCASIACLILILACVNYMNLSTSQFSLRSKEIGMRKILGSRKLVLVLQFLAESYVVTALSFMIAVAMVIFLLPRFNELLGRTISLTSILDAQLMTYLCMLFLATGFLSGVYPAFFLSSLQPLLVLKNAPTKDIGSVRLRKILVVLQFFASIGLVSGTIIIHEQLRFIQSRDVGFSADQTIVIPLKLSETGTSLDYIRNEFTKIDGIRSVSMASGVLGSGGSFFQSGVTPIVNGAASDDRYVVYNGSVDSDFVRNLQIEFKDGRNFDSVNGERVDQFIINEAAAKLFATDPIGMKVSLTTPLSPNPLVGEIIGIVKDFNFESMHSTIAPFLVFTDSRILDNLYLEVDASHITETLRGLNAKWTANFPNVPFDYQFLDEEFNKNYAAEQKLGKLLDYFSILAVFIGSLGLFGLASFSVEQRKKEVSIRKVLGASTTSIVRDHLKEYMIYILIGLTLAVPACLWAVKAWLNTFAHQVGIEIWYFLLSVAMVAVISLVTVSGHIIRAARTNPATVLRNE